MEKIICPHCGAENIKSSIITTCTRCLESLKGAKDAPTELPVATAPPSPEPVELIPDERAAEPGLFAEPPVAPEPVPPTARPARRRAIGEQTSKKAGNALGCGCLVAIALGVVLAKFVHLHVAASIGLAVLCFAVLTAAMVFIQQHAARVASSFYDASIDEPQWYFAPGQSFEAPITVRAKRQLRIGDARVVLECEEHAINRGGTSDTHYRKTIFEREYSLGAPRELRPGEEAVLRTKLTVPPTGTPTFRGKNNFIEWKLRLTVPIPGYCPDIREEIELHVTPRVADASVRGLPKDSAIPEEWLANAKLRDKRREISGVHAELEARDGATVQGLPAIPVGATRKLNLTVRTDEDIHCRGVQCWVGCRIHGSGTSEEAALEEEHLIHEGDFRAGLAINRTISVTIPPYGPVTFIGRYVKCEWMVRVRVDIPVWRDKRIELPIVVTPRLTAEPD